MTLSRAFFAVLALVLWLAPAVSAEPITGSGQITGKDLTSRVIQIEGENFQLSPTATIVSVEGARTTLTSLPVPPIGKADGLWPLVYATYQGQKGAAGAVIDRLELTPNLD